MLGTRPDLALVNDRDAPAESLEWLGDTTEQSANSCPQCVHDETAIIAVQEKNETNTRMVGVQTTKSIDQGEVVRGAVADEHPLGLGRLVSLEAIGNPAAATSNI